MQFDVPANSQILGQIAYEAGIEGILFPSVKTDKKNLAIYPENFKDSDAYIEIRGEVSNTVVIKELIKIHSTNSSRSTMRSIMCSRSNLMWQTLSHDTTPRTNSAFLRCRSWS